MNAKPPDWTRDESRYVDGALDEEQARRLEERRAADPNRSTHLDTWKTAMDLWREDARLASRTVDPETIADRVLSADASSYGEPPAAVTATVARRYAAAAMILIAFGVLGAMWIGPSAPTATAETGDLHVIEQERLALQGDDELRRFARIGGR